MFGRVEESEGGNGIRKRCHLGRPFLIPPKVDGLGEKRSFPVFISSPYKKSHKVLLFISLSPGNHKKVKHFSAVKNGRQIARLPMFSYNVR